jgi:hypothetical protein
MAADLCHPVWGVISDIAMAVSISFLTRSPWIHLLGGPVLWITHFLISYALGEFGCDARLPVLHLNILGFSLLSWIILSFTLIVTFVASFVGWSAYRSWKRLKRSRRKDEQDFWEVEARQFMAFSGMLLGALFSLIILVSGLPVLVLDPCT